MNLFRKHLIKLTFITSTFLALIFQICNHSFSYFLFNIFIYSFIIILPYTVTISQCIEFFLPKESKKDFIRSYILEIISIFIILIYTPIYISFHNICIFSDWQITLYNNALHSPIYTQSLITIFFFASLAIIGYLILRFVPLKKLSPIFIVMSFSFMYMGCIISLLYLVQIFSFDYLFLSFMPIHSILITIHMFQQKIKEWQHIQKVITIPFTNPFLSYLYTLTLNSQNWPLISFLCMIPFLIISIMILVLFGQKPDALIQAWTQTSDWNLSAQVSPQNIFYDEHYLCTVAAGGHKKIVKPLRKGIRHHHEVIVNRQLCIANAFEQIIQEKTPRFHLFIRHIYDTYGYPIAKHIHSPYIADLIYYMMKPLEYIFLFVIYLVDVHPEDRIAMQYIKPIPKNFKEKNV